MKTLHTQLQQGGSNESRTLASRVEIADTTRAQLRGLMFRRSIPDNFALVFRFGSAGTRVVHMLFVFEPLDVLWTVNNEVRRTGRLEPWTGMGVGEADTLIELPAGGADGVTVGDTVWLSE